MNRWRHSFLLWFFVVLTALACIPALPWLLWCRFRAPREEDFD